METKNLLKSLKRRLSGILMLTVLLCAPQSVWAWAVAGDFNGWNHQAYFDSESKYSVNISTTGDHTFGIDDNGNWYACKQSNCGTITRTDRTGWKQYTGQGEGQNTHIEVDVPGTYTFRRTDNTPTITVDYPWGVYGDFDGSWKLWPINDGTATITGVTAGDHEYKIFTSKASSCNCGTCGKMTRSNCSDWQFHDNNNDNACMNADIAGTYTFSWNESTFKLNVTYPTPPQYYLKHSGWSGDGTGWGWKELEYQSDGNYTVDAVYGGSGCNYNTSASDSGARWVDNPTLEGNPIVGDLCTFTYNVNTNAITIAFKSCGAPKDLLIKGPLVTGGWGDYTKENVGYTHEGNVYTYTFTSHVSGDEAGEFCLASAGNDSHGKINSRMDATRTGWQFKNGSSNNNFKTNGIADNKSITITVTYNPSNCNYTMTVVPACTDPAAPSFGGTNRTSCVNIHIAFPGLETGNKYMVVRYEGTSPQITAPTKGQGYSVNDNIGDGKVVWINNAAADDFAIDADKAYTFVLYQFNPACYYYTKASTNLTVQAGTPVVSTSDASNVGLNYATLGGTISSTGAGGAILYSGIEWTRTVGGKTAGTREQISNQNITTFSKEFTGLQQGITYYYKAYSSNNSCSSNYGYGEEKSFTTLSCTPPTVYSVSGTAAICREESATITLSNSETGYKYKLYKDDAEVSSSEKSGNTGSSLTWTVSEAGTYTVTGYMSGDTSCSNQMSGSAVITIKSATVTTSPALDSVHPYEVLTLTADKSVSWSLSPASETAYISTESGSSTIFKGAVGTYTITASANGCDTATNFTVVADEDKCNK